jgi:hypothetical protein
MTNQVGLKSPLTTFDEIEPLIQQLSHRNHHDAIDNAMLCLVSIDDRFLSRLIQPTADKSIWENAATVLQKIGYPRLNAVLPELMTWLQDMNWPGARTIFQVLSKCPDRKILVDAFAQSLNKARLDKDDEWVGGLKKLILAAHLSREDFEDATIFDVALSNDEY